MIASCTSTSRKPGNWEALEIPKAVPFTVTRVRTSHGGTRCEFGRLNGAGSPLGDGPAPAVQVNNGKATRLTSDHMHPEPVRITPIAAKMLASWMTAIDTLLEAQVQRRARVW